MGEVIELISRDERNNQDVERGLRDGLERQGFTPEAIKVAVDTVMPLIKEAKAVFSKGLSFSINTEIETEVLKKIQEELSKELPAYQSEASTFTLRIMLLLAIEIAKHNEI